LKINIFWFRRDLRLEDNVALDNALSSGVPVLPLFIFDTNITDELPADDPRVSFIYDTISQINKELQKSGSSIHVLKGDPETIWNKLIVSFDINAVYLNKDYEPYAIKRDGAIEELLRKNQIAFYSFKDQVIFEEKEILKSDNSPYTIFTPYKNRWLQKLAVNISSGNAPSRRILMNYHKCNLVFPSRIELNFQESSLKVRPFDLKAITGYGKYRDFPSIERTSFLGPHLRFGTVSIRKIVRIAAQEDPVFLSELIWREFFMQILFNFPNVVTGNFKSKYDYIQWINNEKEFMRWCMGETGFPIVDAGMRQLNETGFMHNRVRMITSGFLCKHLLIDWRWGEAYFAKKLLDYELSSNNGNWQWAAGTGCDAAPYFRIFSPDSQQSRFDRKKEYIRKWVPEFEEPRYPEPIIDHDFARRRAVEVYKEGLKKRYFSGK
jgi:deoxyribodipyrimidine photo-lyase